MFLLLILLGVGIGALCAVSPGGFFVFVLAAAVTAAFLRWGGKRNRLFLAWLFGAGFFVRAALSLSLDVGSWMATKNLPRISGPASGWSLGVSDQTRGYLSLGDSDYYSQRAYAYAEFARGSREPVVLYRIQEYGWNLYPTFMGWFYYLFGFSPFSVKLLNTLVGALLGPVLCGIAMRWGVETVARPAGVLVNFFPSLILWSTCNLKDPLLFLCTALLFYCLSALEKARTWMTFLFLLACGAVLFQLHLWFGRPDFSWTIIGLLGIVLCLRWAMRRPWAWILLVSVAVLGLVRFLPRVDGALLAAFNHHVGYEQCTGMAYRYLPNRFYESLGPRTPDMLLAVPNAVFHFLTEPLPYRTSNVFTLMVLPQMFLWYVLLPFALWGMVTARVSAPVSHLCLVGTLCAWIAMGALSMGNVGTVFRVRDMVTPFLLLYAVIGIRNLTHVAG